MQSGQTQTNAKLTAQSANFMADIFFQQTLLLIPQIPFTFTHHKFHELLT